MTKTTSLADLLRGRDGVVADVMGPRPVATRLLEMGLTAGTKVRVVRRALFGDPIELEVRGYRLTLRLDEARMVTLR